MMKIMMMMIVFSQGGQVFPLMSADAAERAVADVLQQEAYMPATSARPSLGLDSEPVSMTTSSTSQHGKDVQREPYVLEDVKVLRCILCFGFNFISSDKAVMFYTEFMCLFCSNFT